MAFSKPISTILLIHDEFSQSERLIADYILANSELVIDMTVRELAKASYCSPALIMKFIHKLGYESYIVFKLELKTQNIKVNESVLRTFMLVDNFVEDNKERIEEFILEMKAAKRIFIYAAGQSKVPALDFSSRLIRRKWNVIFNVDPVKEISTLSEITKDDLVIFISNSGNARELQSYSAVIKNDIILVTNNTNFKIKVNEDRVFCLDNKFDDEYTFRDYPVSSKYSLVYFFDLIFLNM